MGKTYQQPQGKNIHHDESAIQAAIVRSLQEHGVWCFAVPNEHIGAKAQRIMRAISMGLKPGVSDLVAWVPVGDHVEHVYLEVKVPGGRLSDNQKRFATRCRNNQVWHFVVYSPEEALQAVEIVTDALSYGEYEITQRAASQRPLNRNSEGGAK